MGFSSPLTFPGCTTTPGLFLSYVTLDSEPSGAKVTIDGDPAGVTPLKVHLDAARAHLIVARKDNWAGTAALVMPTTPGHEPRLFLWSSTGVLGELLNREPGTVDIWLKSSDEGDPYSAYLQDVKRADAWEVAGRLTAEEHRQICLGLADFYGPSRP